MLGTETGQSYRPLQVFEQLPAPSTYLLEGSTHAYMYTSIYLHVPYLYTCSVDRPGRYIYYMQRIYCT